MQKTVSAITIDFLLLVILVAIASQSIPPIADFLAATVSQYGDALATPPEKLDALPDRLFAFVFNYSIFLGEPIKWALVSVCFIIIFLYLCVNLLLVFNKIKEKTAFFLKSAAVISLIAITVLLPCLFGMIADTRPKVNAPHPMSKEARKIQKAARMVLLERRNPYNGKIRIRIPGPETEPQPPPIEETFSASITTLVSSLPTCVIVDGLFDYYDQRITYIVYGILLIVILLTLNVSYISRLALLVFLLFFSPFRIGFYSGSDAIVPVFWLFVCLHGLLKKNYTLSSVSIALAALAHPFLCVGLLFYIAYLFGARKTQAVKMVWHLFVVFAIIGLFWLLFRSAGLRPLAAQAVRLFRETPVMRPGSYGFSNVLAFTGLLTPSGDSFPFWIIASALALILFLPLAVRQKRNSSACAFFENLFVVIFVPCFFALPSFNNDAVFLTSSILAGAAIFHLEGKEADLEKEPDHEQ